MIAQPCKNTATSRTTIWKGLLGNRKQRRRAIHRLSTAIICISLCLGMELQQTRADYFILNGFPTREFIPVGPSLAAIAIAGIKKQVQRVIDRISSVSETALGTTPEFPGGTPWPWQVSDQVGPFSIVNVNTGNLFTAIPIVSWDEFAFTIYHNSRADAIPSIALSTGWTHSYSAHIFAGATWVQYFPDDGGRLTYDFDAGTTTVVDREHRIRLDKITNGANQNGWTITDDLQNIQVFNTSGRLEYTEDASGNRTHLTYGKAGQLLSITDPGDRTLYFHYSGDGQRMTAIEAPPLVNYGPDPDQYIERIYDLEYLNTNGQMLLEKIGSPRREALGDAATPALYHIFVAYDTDNVKIKYITDYENNGTKIEYLAPAFWNVKRIEHPAVFDYVLGDFVATSRSYEYLTAGEGYQRLVTDERGGVTEYLLDSNKRLTQVIDPLGRTVSVIGWNAQNRPNNIQNVLGGKTAITYDADGNPITSKTTRNGITYTTTTSYDSLNRLLTIEDPVGNTTKYFYDDLNNPTSPTAIATVGPGGPTPEDSVNRIEFDWIGASSPALGALSSTASSGSAAHGKLRTMTSPNGTSTTFHYDRNRNVIRQLESDHDEGGCDQVESTYQSSVTGESSVSGITKDGCGTPYLATRAGLRGDTSAKNEETEEDSNSQGSIASQHDCIPEDAEVECDLCGCTIEFDECGCPIDMQLDEENCIDDAFASVANINNVNCASGKIEYNGNQQLTCAPDRTYTGHPYNARYDLTYDERGRLVQTNVVNPDEAFELQQVLGHVRIQSNYSFTADFSDTAGQHRTIYFREFIDTKEGEGFDATTREIKTEYVTDAAGRVILVERDGQRFKYQYTDSTVAPAVTEIRPDGSSTEIFLDEDGSVRRILHLDSMGVAIASFGYTRDENGRVIQILEDFVDPNAAGGIRSECVEYTYGDGNLTLTDLDDVGMPIPSLDKLYYAYIENLGKGVALLDGDPNRLVMEQRTAANESDRPVVNEFRKEYRYDQGGNRLAVRVSVPANPTGDPGTCGDLLNWEDTSVTRYNYTYRDIVSTNAVGDMAPGTPRPVTTPAMDYVSGGLNKLISTQTYYPNDPDRVDVTEFIYGSPADFSDIEDDDDNIIGKIASTWQRAGHGSWLEVTKTTTDYSYHKGKLEFVRMQWIDTCPGDDLAGGCASPDEVLAERWDFNYYDPFGRRIANTSCQNPFENNSSEFFPPDPIGSEVFKYCKTDVLLYDYEGLSNRVVATRHGPYLVDQDGVRKQDPPNNPYDDFGGQVVGDRFVSTFTYGPLGISARTDEGGDSDPANNKEYYYLGDATGGHVGLSVDHDDDPQTERVTSFNQFDAFGVNMDKPIFGSGPFKWRGGEGSVSDSGTGLVYMQARHYDPSLGRFIQADARALASMTTQGMNRYIYTENDPVNNSDPSGTNPVWLASVIAVALGWIAIAFNIRSLGILAAILATVAIFPGSAAGIGWVAGGIAVAVTAHLFVVIALILITIALVLAIIYLFSAPNDNCYISPTPQIGPRACIDQKDSGTPSFALISRYTVARII